MLPGKPIYVHTHTHTHTLEYYSAVKKNETMTFAVTWMDPEIVMLSEVREGEISYLYILIQRRMIE